MVTGSCLDAGHDVKTSENIEICMEVRNREQLHSYTGLQEVCRSGRGEGGRMRTRGLGERERWHREEKHNVIIRPHCQTRGRYYPRENFLNNCKDLGMMAVQKISPPVAGCKLAISCGDHVNSCKYSFCALLCRAWCCALVCCLSLTILTDRLY